MQESNKDGPYRDPTWGEISCPDCPLWKTDGLTEWDKDNLPDVGGLPPLPFTFNVRSARGIDHHPVFGGFCDGKLLMVMYRFFDDKDPAGRLYPADTVATVGPQDTYLVIGSVPGTHLRLQDWWRFGEMRAGSYFKIQGRMWAKLAIKDLRKLLKNRIFDMASCLAKPYPAGLTACPGEEIYVAKNYPPRPRKPALRFIHFPSNP